MNAVAKMTPVPKCFPMKNSAVGTRTTPLLLTAGKDTAIMDTTKITSITGLDPHLDADAVVEGLAAWVRVVAGEGPAGALSPGERFRWLTAPRSTVLQAGPVHTGLTADPEAEIERLADLLVR